MVYKSKTVCLPYNVDWANPTEKTRLGKTSFKDCARCSLNLLLNDLSFLMLMKLMQHPTEKTRLYSNQIQCLCKMLLKPTLKWHIPFLNVDQADVHPTGKKQDQCKELRKV